MGHIVTSSGTIVSECVMVNLLLAVKWLLVIKKNNGFFTTSELIIGLNEYMNE